MAAHDKEALELKNQGFSHEQIREKLGLATVKQVNHAINRARKNGSPAAQSSPSQNLTAAIYQHLSKPRSRDDLCSKFDVSPRVLSAAIEDLKDSGVLINESSTGELSLCRDVIPPEENKHDAPWSGEKIIRFAFAGDKQFNSKYTQIAHLHNFYDICEREGITTIYDTGDIDEGEEMRPGHKYECYNQGADDHIAEIVKNHPRREGIKTYFITGNHDHSLIKRAGYDIGHAIAQNRDDLVYLGQSYATISLTPNCVLELRHPIDGTAYAISYKTQKMIDAMHGGEKPNVLAIGHYHKAEYIFYRNVHAFQTGCFQGQTNWMKGKQIAAHVGGWIVELHVNDEGTVTRCRGEFIPYFRAIKDDYKNWR